jgi:hypothetical protein
MLRAVLATAVLATGALLGALPEAQAQSLVPCARENGFCRVPYPTRVIYGIPGRSAEVFVREGGIPCSNGAFGDPAPGVPKRCAYVARRYDRGDRWRDDGHRGPPPPRGYDRGFKDYDDGYERPVRRYNVY